MSSHNQGSNGAMVESLGLKFHFTTENDKLIIEASLSSSRDNQLWIGQIATSPYVDFQDVKELLVQGKFKTLANTVELLKIKVGPVPIELHPKSKSEHVDLKQQLKKSLEKQEEMQKIINFQKNKLNAHQNMINDLRRDFEEFKSRPQISVTMMQNINQDLNNKIKQLGQSVKSETSALKNEFLSESSELSKNSKLFAELTKQVIQIKEQVQLQSDNMKFLTNDINQLKEDFQVFADFMRKQIGEIKKKVDSQSENLAFLKIQCNQNEIFNKTMFDNLIDRLKKLQKSEVKINQLQQASNGPKTDLKQEEQQKQRSNNIPIKKDQEKKLSLPNEFYSWSQVLKSNKVLVNGKFAGLFKQSIYGEVCLSDTVFSQSVNQKQSWAIKIKVKRDYISLGICLKSMMQKYNFECYNINWSEIGHGQYSISSGGNCFSHSQKFVNSEKRQFVFNEGDMIFIEYDPIGWNLKFTKNKFECEFSMTIIPPPQNDTYHPFVSLRGEFESVKLINNITPEKFYSK